MRPALVFRLLVPGLLASCVAAPPLPSPAGPPISYVTQSGERVPLDAQAGCLEIVHIPGRRGGRQVLLKNGVSVPGGLARLPSLVSGVPEAARKVALSDQLPWPGAVLSVVGVVGSMIGVLAAVSGPIDPAERDGFIAAGVVGVNLFAGGVAMLVLSRTALTASVRSYNRWAAQHGCE